MAIGALLLAGTAWPALAQNAGAQSTGGTPAPQTAEPATTEAADQASQDDIIVKGYRESLASSTNAKRNSTGFSDTIFAEDIGKFPDTNIAETFNRIPGITISRETTGEGLNIAIRGLGTNFTKVLLNGAPVAIASTGRTDSQSTNREVDLDLFPIELFTQLTVNKTQSADMVEGGTSGVVNMRSARPFDNPGTHLTYSLQGVENTSADKIGFRGSLIASGTFGDFGVLVGAAGFRNQVRTVGYETIGLTNPNLSAAQFGAATGANATGGGNFTIPATVPANAGNGLTTGTTIDQAFLLAHNPGATIAQIDNGLIPRLGRPSDEFGTKDRYNGIVSLEYRPSDDLHVYLDAMYGRKKNDLQRIDMNWVGRNGAVIPLNTQYDRTDCSAGCVVTKGTYANAQFFLEYRPFIEDTQFWGVNPGAEWKFADNLKLNLQGNYTKSVFHRESPTVLVITPPSSGVTVNYDYNNGGVPIIGVTGANLNDPASFGWNGGRVNIQDEKRHTQTKGIRGDLTWGDQKLSLKVGGSYDDISRRIQGFDNSQAFQNAVCGDNPSIFLPGPNSQPPCLGANVVGSPAALNAIDSRYPLYPGYGAAGGYSAGATTPYTYAGSLIPLASLGSYLKAGPDGFITVDWDKFKAASHYDQFHTAAPESSGTNTGASGGYVRERSTAAFAEVNGDLPVGDNQLNFNAGVRWVHTQQEIGGFVSLPDPRNTPAAPAVAPADGGKFPNLVNFVYTDHSYDNWLPSVSAAFHIGTNAVLRGSVSRTMTRPDPNAQLPGLSFSSPSADVGSVGNSALQPYLSTNFDVGFEYYTGKEGYVGVAAFRKAITGFTTNGTATLPFGALAAYGVTYDTLTPTQQAAITARGGPGSATVVINQQINATGTLFVNGLELNWVQPLDFLLGKYLGLNGFGFNANLTLIDQHGTGAAPAIALGVSPVSYNITAYYEGHGLTVRASTTFNRGSQSSGTNQNGIAAAALFTSDYQQYDLSSSLDLGKVFGTSGLPELTFDVVNIFNAEQRSYFQFPNATFTSYKPGTTFFVGLRGRF
jgi:TonB-dependent receptor